MTGTVQNIAHREPKPDVEVCLGAGGRDVSQMTAAAAGAQGAPDTTRRLLALRLEPDERITIDGRFI